MYEYWTRLKEQLDVIIEIQKDTIDRAIQMMGQSIISDKIIHTFGTGHSHMIGLELFARAGGLANVNAMLDSTVMTFEGARRSAEIERLSGMAQIIWDQHTVTEGDLMIVISNSGRNAMPIEMAQIAKSHGLTVIAITSVQQSRRYPSRHQSKLKLMEIADIVIDNCVPPGDGLVTIDDTLTGAASTISGAFIVNLLATEAMKIAADRGVNLPIYFSQNIDGFSNDELYTRYEGRVKHL
jgi:uncharacterized phosphosugar-binding protein